VTVLRDHGLKVKYSKYVFGCATGVAGRKPELMLNRTHAGRIFRVDRCQTARSVEQGTAVSG
jgi:hypothetical protein